MPLPALNAEGDLPVGLHPATLADVLASFGHGTPQREAVAARLVRVHELALRTAALERFVVFGSFITDKPEPDDVDVILVMRSDFRAEACPLPSRALLDHQRADTELGASIFWVRPDMLLGETIDQFLTHWQRKRDGQLRGIVEVVP